MDSLEKNTQQLIQAIRESEIYKNYMAKEEKLKKDPDLMARIGKFRADSFHLQNEISKDNLFERTHALTRESAELGKSKDVNSYLDAELALCKLVQKICMDITEGIDIDIPEI